LRKLEDAPCSAWKLKIEREREKREKERERKREREGGVELLA
jgi:hypothetical protein